ncbi:MAG: hypothetical protein NZ604_03145 [Flavobacteriales bacterium]|nr:hypothetical protein [Flavobacteriales bacterium]
MFKHFFHISILAILFSSCQEININKEVKYTTLLDSVLFHQQELIDNIDTVKINSYVQKAKERIRLFESPSLNDFQKQWLHHEKLAYQKIYTGLDDFNKQMDSLEREFNYSKSQIQALKEDLVHRHLNKELFNAYFTDEQKALAELNILTEKLHKIYTENLNNFDSLEFKLQGILIQLDALQSNHAEPTEK